MDKQTILVTGAGRGAGLGIAKVLAGEGNNIVVCDLNPETSEQAAETVRERGANALSIACDVSNEEQVEGMFEKIVASYGTLDVLINTVAWIDPPGPIVDMPTDRWQMAIRTNLDSVMYCTRAALRIMIPNRAGNIVNISSISGTRGFPERASYGATKAAIINLTQTTAMENRHYGISANCLVPGGIKGERNTILRERRAQRAAETGEAPQQDYPNPPMELLDPEWIGRYVSFLVSEGGRHINGQALVVGEAGRSPLQAMFPDI